jgi:hypothetical protein
MARRAKFYFDGEGGGGGSLTKILTLGGGGAGIKSPAGNFVSKKGFGLG